MKHALRWVALATWLGCVAATSAADAKFDFDALRARAKALAAKPHVPPKVDVPEWLRNFSYDNLHQVRFQGRESLWFRDKLPFQVQFIHPGYTYDKTVHLHEVVDGRARPLNFEKRYFSYREVKAPVGEIPEGMGFAGFRLMYPLPGHDGEHVELGSFLGASYYRLLFTGAAYGLSARGLALNTAEPGPEEFPIFTEFWLEKPAPTAKTMNVYALLDSESVTGAYRFSITPGDQTLVQVKAAVFCRKNAKVFGIAPLTSMFWRGENSTVRNEDFRPEVHDSDGLLIHNGHGEWIWRPLDNPHHVRVAAFSDEDPRAFGLLQRDRDFEHYQDLEASYHARPSAWIEPIGKWGRGSVRLVELPTANEFNDNIVAFWVPEKLPPPGEPIDFEYRQHWFSDQIKPPAGFVRATRHGKTAYYEPGMERFVIDFDGAQLQKLKADDKKIEHVLWIGDGAKLNHSTLQKNKINGTWRVAFTIRPDGSGKPIEMRCFLRREPDVLTETWSFLWQP